MGSCKSFVKEFCVHLYSYLIVSESKVPVIVLDNFETATNIPAPVLAEIFATLVEDGKLKYSEVKSLLTED